MVYEILGKGKEHARTAKDLSKELHISVRDVMEFVRKERFSGFPICASSKGYYIAKDRSEIESTIKRLYATARETKSIADAMSAYFR